MGIGRSNPRSFDILEHILRAMPPFLNSVMFCKEQDLKSCVAGVWGLFFNQYHT